MITFIISCKIFSKKSILNPEPGIHAFSIKLIKINIKNLVKILTLILFFMTASCLNPNKYLKKGCSRQEL